ncbi:HLH domain containing protein [Trichuris trichiura]|uniref:HLH domain containing protein n=1 Tax=Trichuris trichiura TaxID=36087 RepID=A0A077Z0L4_TRITR|nr:HLH domain containing protein [Trichuris trichiura]
MTRVESDEQPTGRPTRRTGLLVKAANKPLMEKRRRARINKSLDELKAMLMGSMKRSVPSHSKWEKADILEMSVQYVRTLRGQVSSRKCNAFKRVFIFFDPSYFQETKMPLDMPSL